MWNIFMWEHQYTFITGTSYDNYSPRGNRTPILRLKVLDPKPLDDRANISLGASNSIHSWIQVSISNILLPIY